MKLSKLLLRPGRLPKSITTTNRYKFCKKQQQGQTQKINPVFKFLRDGWRQTFPNEEDQVKRKYQKVKNVKRYTAEQLAKIQGEIPEYQRTALVETQIKGQQQKKGFKVSNLIPQSIKTKLKQSSSYKEYADFKENFKQYVNTSDSAAINVGNKAYKAVSQPSSTARATDVMRQYDKQFNIMDLQKQSTFIFRDAYQQFLQGNLQNLQMLCGESAFDLLRSLLKINTTKKIRPKYTQILHYTPSKLKKTMMSQSTLPSFLFQINLMEIYCMIDAQGNITDGDDERIMESTYQFLLKYSGEYIGELGHPWQIVEMRKINEVKMLI